jgi:hypothetical protein
MSDPVSQLLGTAPRRSVRQKPTAAPRGALTPEPRGQSSQRLADRSLGSLPSLHRSVEVLPGASVRLPRLAGPTSVPVRTPPPPRTASMPATSLITNTSAASAVSSSCPAWQSSVVEECEPDDAPLELLEPRDGTDEFDVRHALPATMSYLHLVRPYTRMQEANQRAVQAAQDAKWRSDKARARVARSERVAAAESNRKDDAKLRHRVGLELLRTPHAGGPQQRAQLLAAMALAAPRELQPLPDGTTRVDGESAITVAEGLNRWRVRAAAKYEAQAAQELEPAALGVVPPSPPPMDVALASGQSPRPSPFASTPFVLPTPTAAALRGLFQWKAGAGGDAAKARSTDTLLSPTYFPRLPHASDPPPEMTPPGSTLLMFPLHLDGAAAAARRASTASLPFRDSARDDSAWAVEGSPAGLPPPLQIRTRRKRPCPTAAAASLRRPWSSAAAMPP